MNSVDNKPNPINKSSLNLTEDLINTAFAGAIYKALDQPNFKLNSYYFTFAEKVIKVKANVDISVKKIVSINKNADIDITLTNPRLSQNPNVILCNVSYDVNIGLPMGNSLSVEKIVSMVNKNFLAAKGDCIAIRLEQLDSLKLILSNAKVSAINVGEGIINLEVDGKN